MLLPYHHVEIHTFRRSRRGGPKTWIVSSQVWLKDMRELPRLLRQKAYSHAKEPWRYEYTYRILGIELRNQMEEAGRPNNPVNDCPECNYLRVRTNKLCREHQEE